MREPIFLELDEVLELHRMEIERRGGDHGLRDLGLLEAAVAMPRSTFGGDYLHTDLSEMAAAYAFHITNNHAFVDGNKRTAALAAAAFLDLNRLEFRADPDAYADLMLRASSGQASKQELAEFFRRHTTPREAEN